ncbi:MAG: Methyltransferase [Parcubacteria group bacterium]|nr:Methyltransferase [Parcubacteria group bacterium]
MINKSPIPSYVSNWTDKYFHQSAFGVPLKFPTKKATNFLAKFKREEKIKLYRGIHRYNKENYTGVESWTYDKKIAVRYASDEIEGKVIEKIFDSKNILLDTTLLDEEEKVLLGYDYKIDDKEVLVII